MNALINMVKKEPRAQTGSDFILTTYNINLKRAVKILNFDTFLTTFSFSII